MSLWVGVDCGVAGIADLGGLGASGHRYCYTSAKALTTQRKHKAKINNTNKRQRRRQISNVTVTQRITSSVLLKWSVRKRRFNNQSHATLKYLHVYTRVRLFHRYTKYETPSIILILNGTYNLKIKKNIFFYLKKYNQYNIKTSFVLNVSEKIKYVVSSKHRNNLCECIFSSVWISYLYIIVYKLAKKWKIKIWKKIYSYNLQKFYIIIITKVSI